MTMSRIASVALTAAVFALVGCGSSSGGSNNNNQPGGNGGGGGKPAPTSAAVRCDTPARSSCFEIPTTALKGTDDAQQLAAECQKQGGSFSYGGCSTTNHVGTCSVNVQGIPLKIRFYSPAPADRAQQACQQQGGAFSKQY